MVICLAPSAAGSAAAVDRMSFIRNPGFRDHYLGTYLDGYKSHFSRTSIGTGIDLPRLLELSRILWIWLLIARKSMGKITIGAYEELLGMRKIQIEESIY